MASEGLVELENHFVYNLIPVYFIYQFDNMSNFFFLAAGKAPRLFLDSLYHAIG